MTVATLTDYGVTVEVMAIEPETAKQWLKEQAPNRHLRPRFVKQLAEDIKAGKWLLNGAPIRFSSDGRLLDGQHRLNAIVQANVTVESVVVTGISKEASETIDQGMARKFGDVLKIRGEKNYAILAAATSWCLSYEASLIGAGAHGPRGGSVAAMLEQLEKTPNLRQGAAWAASVSKVSPLIPSHAAFLWSLFSEFSETDRDEFLAGVVTGEGLGEAHPALVLRNLLLKTKSRIHKPDAQTILAWEIKSWNAFRRSESIGLLKWAPWKEEFPRAE